MEMNCWLEAEYFVANIIISFHRVFQTKGAEGKTRELFERNGGWLLYDGLELPIDFG